MTDTRGDDARRQRDRPGRAATVPPLARSPSAQYDIFLAYTHRSDSWRAKLLQEGLQGLVGLDVPGPPSGRPPLRVFRDVTDLPGGSAGEGLWPSIAEAMDGSASLVILASPASARSLWVGMEIVRWLVTRPAGRIRIVCTAGEWAWSPSGRCFDVARSSAIHPALTHAFDACPRVVDMTWATATTEVDGDRLREVLLDIASPVCGDPRLQGAGRRIHRTEETRPG